MSGNNRLINSVNTIKKGSQKKLCDELMNGNESALLDEKYGTKIKYSVDTAGNSPTTKMTVKPQ